MDTAAKRLNADLERGQDDFDYFEGIGAFLDRVFPFALMHYRGHPEGTFTIYLTSEVKKIDQISKCVENIVKQLDIPAESIEWQRSMNPEL